MFPRIDEQGLLQLLSKRHVNNDNKETMAICPTHQWYDIKTVRLGSTFT